MAKLYSYDIFDTLITRRTATPHGIFAVMQEKLKNRYTDIPAEIRENFFELRIQGERFARQFYCKNGWEDVTLRQIYHAINTTGLLNKSMIERLMELEWETELENMIPISSMIQEVLEHFQSSDDVILISDMYLDKKIIYKLLETAEPQLKEIPLYLSSDIGKMKASGNLFRFVHEDRKIPYEKWVHIGDNPVSDILIPEKLGIKTVRVHERLPMALETAMLAGQEQEVSIQMLVGISKNTRLLYGLEGEAAVGASLTGFLLGSYINWVVKDAVGRGIKTLYFVARDGYVLKKVADIFIKAMGYDIETKYLYGSRKAWRMPSLVSEDIDILGLLRASTPWMLCDLRAVAEVFGIPVSELQCFLPLNKKSENRNLSRVDVDIVFYYLSECEEFKKYLARVNREKQSRVLAYLKQEIHLQQDHLAFVEVGGTGYTQKCLEYMLKEIYKGTISTYFFQLYSAKEGETDTFYNFIPDVLPVTDAIEPLCRAPHGQTLGYVERDGHIEPELEGTETGPFYACGYDRYIKGFLDYAQTYMAYYRELFPKAINRRLVKKCWEYYTQVRDEEILNFIGEVPFEVTGGENGDSQYAPKLSAKEIKDVFYTYRNEPTARHYRGASLSMSILRMSGEERKLMEEYKEKDKGGNIQSSFSTPPAACFSYAFAEIPKGRYPLGTRIALYGAGGLGRAFYYAEQRREDYQVVLWTDRQYISLGKRGYPVSCPEDLRRTEFEKVLIAVLERAAYDSIKKDLQYLGVPEEKIDWITPEELLVGNSLGRENRAKENQNG